MYIFIFLLSKVKILIKIFNPFAYVVFLYEYICDFIILIKYRNNIAIQVYFLIHINLLIRYNDKYIQDNKLLYKSNLWSNFHKNNID